MARRLIGLDVGTNAVTVAEVSAGSIPRLDLFAQVALPRDAMREGEVADDGAVSEAVDLMALALTRALAGSTPELQPAMAGGGVAVADHGVGAEGIVSFGGGVTTITVHEGGIPRFVRVLGTGGRELTDAIASDLAIPA